MTKKLITIIAVAEVTIFLLAAFNTIGNTSDYEIVQTLNIGQEFDYVYPHSGPEKTNCVASLTELQDNTHYKYTLCDEYYNNASNYTLVALDNYYQQIDGAVITADKTSGTITLPSDQQMSYIAVINELASQANPEARIIAVYKL